MTQFNSASLNRHIFRTYNFGNGINFGDGFVEVIKTSQLRIKLLCRKANINNRYVKKQVLAATQTPGEAGMNWFQGTADAVRKFTWVFEVGNYPFTLIRKFIPVIKDFLLQFVHFVQDNKNKNIEHILILYGDHLYRMDYMDFIQACYNSIRQL